MRAGQSSIDVERTVYHKAAVGSPCLSGGNRHGHARPDFEFAIRICRSRIVWLGTAHIDILTSQVECARETAGVNNVDMLAKTAALGLECTSALKCVNLRQISTPAIVVCEGYGFALVHKFKRNGVNISAAIPGTSLQIAGHASKADS